MIADVTDHEDHFEVEASPRLSSMISQVPGSRFNARVARWRLPHTLNAIVQLYGLLGPDSIQLDYNTSYQLANWKLKEEQTAALREKALSPEAWPVEEYHPVLDGYQVSAYKFLIDAGSAVLGDDMGVGKSPVAAFYARHFQGPVLLVVPHPIKRQWLKKLQTWWPEAEHIVLEGNITKRRKQIAAYKELGYPGALIVSYAQLPLHSRLASGGYRLADKEKLPKELNEIRWNVLVADEAHRAFSPKTKWTRALWWLAQDIPYRLAMTGTPSEKNALDFWSLLHLVAPEEWPGRSKAQDLYMETTFDFWGGIEKVSLKTNMRDQWDRLVARRFVRREKSLVLPYLPTKQFEPRTVELPGTIRTQYNDLLKEMTADSEGGTLHAFDPGTQYTRLVQAASATLTKTGTREVERDGITYLVDTVAMSLPSPKVDAVLQYAETEAPGQPALIPFNSRQLLELFATELSNRQIPFVKIVGGMTSDQIEMSREQYNSGDARFVLLSVGAAAEGLDLTRGSLILRPDRSPKRRENQQAEDRLHGRGRGDQDSDHLLIVDFVSEDTVDENVLDNLAEKDISFTDLFG